MRQKYLREVQKKMFWRFTNAEIKEVLNDVNLYFKEASNEGFTDEKFVERYGTPDELVNELLETQESNSRNRIKNVIFKISYIILSIILIILSSLFLEQVLSSGINMMIIIPLIWVLSGNGYNLLNDSSNKNAKRNIYLQILFWSVCVILQLFVIFLLPHLFRSVSDIETVGIYVYVILYAIVLVAIGILVLCLNKMLHGDAFMFYLLIEVLSLVYSLLLCGEWLRRIDNLTNLFFIFIPCIYGAIMLLICWKLSYHKERLKNGCTN